MTEQAHLPLGQPLVEQVLLARGCWKVVAGGLAALRAAAIPLTLSFTTT